MVAFNAIKPGDTLWDCHRHQMGNTTIRAMGCWRVIVKEIDAEKRMAFVSWNGNAPQWKGERYLRKLRRTKIDTKRTLY